LSAPASSPTRSTASSRVSTTGIATPSLEARVGPRLGLRGNVRRVPVFGLGCAGGVSGLATAARLAAAEPGTNWL
jgi:alkylresorcinol/alkylpyrone synthase